MPATADENLVIGAKIDARTLSRTLARDLLAGKCPPGTTLSSCHCTMAAAETIPAFFLASFLTVRSVGLLT